MFYYYFFNVYLFLREREHTHTRKWGKDREKGTEDPKRALRWQQRTQHGARTHEGWDQHLSQSRAHNQLSHPGAPLHYCFKVSFFPKFLVGKKSLRRTNFDTGILPQLRSQRVPGRVKSNGLGENWFLTGGLKVRISWPENVRKWVPSYQHCTVPV